MEIDNRNSTNNDSIDHKYRYFWLQSPIVISVLTSLWNRSIDLLIYKIVMGTHSPSSSLVDSSRLRL